jgi:XTP/dITP diphosphohydrolase
MQINYITGNQSKLDNAITFFAGSCVEVIGVNLDTFEIQDEDAVKIAVSKAEQAFLLIGRPLFVNDASWIIPELGGFPGPYMKYVNGWFKPEHFIALMTGAKDRSIILRDIIVYIDDNGTKVFTHDHPGKVLEEVYPGEYRSPSDAVVSLSKDGRSLLEIKEVGFLEGENVVWRELRDWLLEYKI